MPNLFDAIPDRLDDERFETLVTGEAVQVERIVSRGHTSPSSGWYDQAWDEWVIVLKGEGEVVFEDGEAVRLRPGDHLQIPAHRRHRVAWTDPERDTIWLAVHYPA